MRTLQQGAYESAAKLLGIVEVGGNNNGRRVLEIIHANGGTGPEPWCGDTVAWCYRHAGSRAVNRGWATAFALGRIAGMGSIKLPIRGDIVVYTFDHCGIVDTYCNVEGAAVAHHAATHIRTIEGNTSAIGALNQSDSRNGGDGVFRKIRPLDEVLRFVRVYR